MWMNDAKRAVPYAERNFQPVALSIDFLLGCFYKNFYIFGIYQVYHRTVQLYRKYQGLLSKKRIGFWVLALYQMDVAKL